MSPAIYRTEDPTLETVEFSAVYQIHAPRTGGPWTLYAVSDDCGVDSVEPLDIPDGWDDSYEYPMGYARVWSRLARLARDAYLAHATLEVAFVRVDDEETDVDSYSLLARPRGWAMRGRGPHRGEVCHGRQLAPFQRKVGAEALPWRGGRGV